MVVFIEEDEEEQSLVALQMRKRKRDRATADSEDRFDGCVLPDNSYYLGK